MDNIRLILIGIGLVVLIAIILFHRPSGRRRTHARRRTPGGRVEPEFEHGNRADAAPVEEGGMEQPSLPRMQEIPEETRVPAARPPAGEDIAPKPRPADMAKPDKIVTLYVRRHRQTRINGVELLDAAIKAGLSFGEMNIFHRRHKGEDRPVFSMANLTPPGHFDSSGWNLFDTEGVTLFMALPGPVSALDAWDAMLATGRRMAELLEADLIDDSHCVLTRQRIGQIREELREYDRKAGLTDKI